jgi:heme exporter protein CcmD
MLGQYGAFIVPAYAVSAIVIAGLILRTIAIHSSRRAEIRELEERGIKRRAQKG